MYIYIHIFLYILPRTYIFLDISSYIYLLKCILDPQTTTDHPSYPPFPDPTPTLWVPKSKYAQSVRKNDVEKYTELAPHTCRFPTTDQNYCL